MFLEIFSIFFFAILIMGWFSFKHNHVPAYFITGILLIILGGVMFSEGLDIVTGNQLTYDSNKDVNQVLNIVTTETKENNGLISFLAYSLPPIGLIIILWGIIVPFRKVEEEELEG